MSKQIELTVTVMAPDEMDPATAARWLARAIDDIDIITVMTIEPAGEA